VEVFHIPGIVEEQGNWNISLPVAVNLVYPAVVIEVCHDPDISGDLVFLQERDEFRVNLAWEIEAYEDEFYPFVAVFFGQLFEIGKLCYARGAPCSPEVDLMKPGFRAVQDLFQLRDANFFRPGKFGSPCLRDDNPLNFPGLKCCQSNS